MKSTAEDAESAEVFRNGIQQDGQDRKDGFSLG
jgi:hypothetical protein